MQTIAEIESKIRTAESLESIVRTVRTLAMVNLRRFESAVSVLEQYCRNVRIAMSVCLRAMQQEQFDTQVAERGELAGIALLLGSDQGLCGQFNDRVEQHAREVLSDGSWSLLIMGRRLGEHMLSSGYTVLGVLDAPVNVDSIVVQAQRLLSEIEELRNRGRCARLTLVHNEYLTGLQYKETSFDLLPFKPSELMHMPEDEPGFSTLPQISVDPHELIVHLLPEYLLSQVARAIGESMASENAARLLAMEGASRNIEERVSELMAEYHRRRQEEITVELADVLTGASAITDSNPKSKATT